MKDEYNDIVDTLKEEKEFLIKYQKQTAQLLHKITKKLS
jgi:hypothetical protein